MRAVIHGYLNNGCPMKKRKPTSFSLSERAVELIAMLAEHHGLNKTLVLEMIVREEARKLGLE
jgi:hypothetical protein